MQVWNLVEAAKFLGIKPSTLREYAAAGRVPCGKIAGEWRFTDESLEDYMRKLVAPKNPPVEPTTTPTTEPARRKKRRPAPPPSLRMAR